MKKRKGSARFLPVIIIVLLWGGLGPVLPCDAAFPFHISCPSPGGPVLRTLPYYPPYHGIFARRRHFLCGREPLSAQEIQTCAADHPPLPETIGQVDKRYVDRCKEALSQLPAQLCYLFVDYGWHFYVTDHDIAQTEFDGLYSSVKGVTDVQSLYIKVEDRDSATDSSTILHEFGHFLDYCCNFPSEREHFITLMEQELEAAGNMGMRCNPPNNEEYFAESFFWYLTASEQMKDSIPLTWEFMRQCLTETVYHIHE